MTPVKSHTHHGLKLDLAVRADAKRRLQSIRGHVEGILRMLEEDGGCHERGGPPGRFAPSAPTEQLLAQLPARKLAEVGTLPSCTPRDARAKPGHHVYCVDVLKQIKAVEGALGRVGDLVLRSHLAEHVVTAAARGDESRMVDELMELLKYR